MHTTAEWRIKLTNRERVEEKKQTTQSSTKSSSSSRKRDCSQYINTQYKWTIENRVEEQKRNQIKQNNNKKKEKSSDSTDGNKITKQN